MFLLLALVLTALVDPALVSLVIFGATPNRLPATMGLAAAKGTAQVAAPRVARVGEEKDPAVPAMRQALPQPGLNPQDRSQHYSALQK